MKIKKTVQILLLTSLFIAIAWFIRISTLPMGFGDSGQYMFMAENPYAFKYAYIPWNYRVFVPYLAALLPAAINFNFLLLQIFAFAAVNLLLFFWVRDLGLDYLKSLCICCLFSFSYAGTYNLHNITHVGFYEHLVILLGVIYIYRKQYWWLAAIVFTGGFVKESIALLIPLYFFCALERKRVLEILGRSVLLGIIFLSVFYFIRSGAIFTNEVYWRDYLNYYLGFDCSIIYNQYGGWQGALKGIYLTFPILWLLLPLGIVYSNGYSRRFLLLIPLTFLQLSVGCDVSRMIAVCFPAFLLVISFYFRQLTDVYVICLTLISGVTFYLFNISGGCLANSYLLTVVLMTLVIIAIQYRDSIRGLFAKSPLYWLFLIIILVNVFTIPLILKQFYEFNLSNPHDFAERAQAVYNTVSGHPLKTCVMPWLRDVNFSILGDHLFLFLFFLVPFVYFFKTPEFMLVLQSLFLSLSAIPVYLIAQGRLKKSWLSLSAALCFLLHPLMIKLPFFGFRVVYFAIFFFLWSFYFLDKNKFGFTVLFLILAAFCKESLFAVVACFGIYILLFKKSIPGNRLKGALLFLVGIIIPIVYTRLVAVRFCINNEYVPFREHYGYWLEMGITHPLVLKSLFFPKKWLYYLRFFGMLGFLPLFSKEVIFIIPGILQNIFADLHLSQWFEDVSGFITMHIWHNAVILPFLFISFICTAGKIFKNKWGKFYLSIIIILNLGCGIGDFYFSVISPYVKNRLWQLSKPKEYKEFLDIKKYLHSSWPVVVHYPLFNGFWDFERTYVSSLYNKYYAPIDKIDYAVWAKEKDYRQRDYVADNREVIRDMLPEEFIPLIANDGYVIMARKKEGVKSGIDFSLLSDKIRIQPFNVKYRFQPKRYAVIFEAYFDGPAVEDEYVQLKMPPLDISLDNVNWMALDYEIDDPLVQTIEVVVGVDKNNDLEADFWARGLYPGRAEVEQGEFIIPLYRILREDFRNKDKYKIVAIEIYPHKRWKVDCSGRDEWYTFELDKIRFY